MEFKMHGLVNAPMDKLPLLYMLFVYDLKIMTHCKLLNANSQLHCTIIPHSAKTQAKDKQYSVYFVLLMLQHC